MEELPTLGEFKALLHDDPIFGDYFNAFLNLPVFSKRLTFFSGEKRFEIEPSVNYTYHNVDDSKLFSWVHKNRLPVFWSSEFFYEYQLCKTLLQGGNKDGRKWLTGVSALHHFRRFLFHTDGEFGCMFWVDVERLKQVGNNKRLLRQHIVRILELYFHDGAGFALHEAIRVNLLFMNDKCLSRGRQRLSEKIIDTLIRGQELVVARLKEYWCPRYKLHLEEADRKPDQLGALSMCHLQRHCSSQSSPRDKIGATIRSITELDKHKRQHKSQAYLPRIINDKGKDGIDVRPERLSQVLQTSSSKPSLFYPRRSRCTGSVLEGVLNGCYDDDNNDLEKRMRTLDLLLSPSMLTLFPKSAQSAVQDDSSATLLDTCRMASLSPYLTASLRADFISGNPFLRHLKHVAYNKKAVNSLLFWQSVENILTQDEAKRWYRRFEPRSSSDQICPYLSCVETYPVASSLMELLHLFIKDGAPHKIDMSVEVRSELCLLLPRGLGQSLILAAQEKATKFLLRPWQEYLLRDYHNFMKSCTTPKLLTRLASPYRRQHSDSALSHPSRQCLVEMTFSSSLLHSMWCALKFAEAIKYPGIYKLPSRRLTDVSLLQGNAAGREDSDDDISDTDEPVSLDGISLSPMITTVCDQLLWDWKNSKIRRTILCTTKPANSMVNFSRKPPVPKSFLEVLKDREQLEYFRHFLLMHGVSAEAPLEFWIAVEDLKNTISNKRMYKSKIKRIKERFLSGDLQRTLMSPDSVTFELNKGDSPSIFQLLAVQASVAEAMERRWFTEYVHHLTVKEEAEKIEEEETRLTCSTTSRNLWSMFAHNVISFRRGLMNGSTADMFRKFLHEEVIKGNHHTFKKIVGTKVVNVTKLLNDLSFWAEVERYKDLADIIKEGKLKGTHTPEDDILMHKKAHAIVNCYIDSAVSPRVQINIPQDLVGYILDSMSQGEITRGLFHEAALNIFSILILYWKKFCLTRFAPKRQRSADNSTRQEWAGLGGGHVGEEHKEWHSFFGDGGPILSYSLSHGIRWFYPGSHQHHHIEPQQHCDTEQQAQPLSI